MSETETADASLNHDSEPVESQPDAVHQEHSTMHQETCSGHSEAHECPADEDHEYLRKLPPEIGTLLVMVGVAGLLLPGVIGTPLIIAGAVVMWPKTFEPLERRFAKNYPESHRKGLRQVKRFIDDLNRRFPES